MASTLTVLFRGFLVLNALLLLSLSFSWFSLSPFWFTPVFPRRRLENCTFSENLEDNARRHIDYHLKDRLVTNRERESHQNQSSVVSLENKIYEDLHHCVRSPLHSIYRQQGDYWLLQNYIPADVCFHCNESITYTTHAEYTFLDNLEPLVSRWKGPVSMAVYASGSDFDEAIRVILYLRFCGSENIKIFVTFHLFFHVSHSPRQVPSTEELLRRKVECHSNPLKWQDVTTYRQNYKLLYPINVARNLARLASQTYFVLPSDVELYPSLDVIPEFFKMLKRPDFSKTSKPRVYVFPIFEVKTQMPVPDKKKKLLEMLQINDAIIFHKKFCSACHNFPKSMEWMSTPETQNLSVFHIGKRQPPHKLWEPIYIGTNNEPLYDERLSWEGQKDKMSQMYILCVRDYEFHILDNAFLVHRPGIKTVNKKTDRRRNKVILQQYSFVRRTLSKEYRVQYGTRMYCEM